MIGCALDTGAMYAVYLMCTDDWLCARHWCHVCGDAATMLCVFCPISYCDDHADDKIKTISFVVDNFRVRHRVCVSHKSVLQNTSGAHRRQSSKRKSRGVPSSEDRGETEPQIQAPAGIADSCNTAEENVGIREPVTEVPTSMQNVGSDFDGATTVAPQELEKLNPKSSDALVPSSTQEQHPQVKPARGQRRKTITTRLHKQNGIILDVFEASALCNSESAIEQAVCQMNGERPNQTGESADLITGAAKSPGKHCRAPVLNGFHSSVTVTRRRSTLRENGQTLNIAANKLETQVNSSMVADTVTALLEELSETKDLELLNGKELVIDGN